MDPVQIYDKIQKGEMANLSDDDLIFFLGKNVIGAQIGSSTIEKNHADMAKDQVRFELLRRSQEKSTDVSNKQLAASKNLNKATWAVVYATVISAVATAISAGVTVFQALHGTVFH
jgi:hypothetical protein